MTFSCHRDGDDVDDSDDAHDTESMMIDNGGDDNNGDDNGR